MLSKTVNSAQASFMRIEKGECTPGAAAACLLSPARILSDQNKNNRLEAALLFSSPLRAAVRRQAEDASRQDCDKKSGMNNHPAHYCTRQESNLH